MTRALNRSGHRVLCCVGLGRNINVYQVVDPRGGLHYVFAKNMDQAVLRAQGRRPSRISS